MSLLAGLLGNGTITIPILLLTVAEAAALLLYHRITSRGPALRAFLPNLLAGDFLLLAWLASATRQPWPLTALALLAALTAHAADLVLRWR